MEGLTAKLLYIQFFPQMSPIMAHHSVHMDLQTLKDDHNAMFSASFLSYNYTTPYWTV